MISESSCGFYLKQLNDSLAKNANHALKEDNLTIAQSGALLYLDGLPGKQAPLKQLEKALHVAQSTALGIADRLEGKGFLESFGSEEDRRIKLVRLTPAGQRICCKAIAHVTQTENTLLTGFSDAEKEQFLGMLRRACQNMD